MITIHFNENENLYNQIYDYFVTEIRENRIKSGEKLPSRRALSQHLGVSLNTVKLAYEMLLDEGYVVSRERSGFYVDILRTDELPKSTKPREPFIAPPTNHFRFDFSYDKVDSLKMPESILKKCTQEAVELAIAIEDIPKGGVWSLRREIAKYLENRRGLVASPEDIIITSCYTEQLIILLLLLEDPVFGLEDPGYKKSGEIFRAFNKDAIYIPIDKYGFSVKDLEVTDATVAIATPNHQFPTGIIMVLRRRQRLLAWANEKPHRYIVEDDYDSDFKYSGNPIPSLKSLDNHDRVIVLGSFSQSIGSFLGVSYMVLPKALRKKYDKMDLPVLGASIIDQLTLERFLSTGAFEKHINRMNTHYRKKRDIMIKALKKYPEVEIIGGDAGMHLIVRLGNQHWDKSYFMDMAERSEIFVETIDKYSKREWPYFDIILGFGGIEIEKIEEAVEELMGEINIW